MRMEERGDALALLLLPTRLGGYACSAGATAMSIALGAGVVEPEPVTVAVPELKDLGSSDGVGGISSRECERDCGCGFSMSYRGERPSSSSSSEERDARKRGSASASMEERGVRAGKATEAAWDDLTIESMSQNWMMFIIMGNRPMVKIT